MGYKGDTMMDCGYFYVPYDEETIREHIKDEEKKKSEKTMNSIWDFIGLGSGRFSDSPSKIYEPKDGDIVG